MIGIEQLKENFQDFRVDWRLKRTATPTSVAWAKEQVDVIDPRVREAVLFEKAVDAALVGDEADTAAILLQTDLETNLKADLLGIAHDTPFIDTTIFDSHPDPDPFAEEVPTNIRSTLDVEIPESQPVYLLSFD